MTHPDHTNSSGGPWGEGFSAGKRWVLTSGRVCEACPYPSEPASEDWEDGFDVGRAHGEAVAEARAEWDATRPMDQYLAEWAYQVQNDDLGGPATGEVEDLANEWAVPVEFIEELLCSANPYQFLADNQILLAEAANVRYARQRG